MENAFITKKQLAELLDVKEVRIGFYGIFIDDFSKKERDARQ